MRCGAQERQRLEPFCRYIARPALTNERLRCNAAGQVALKLKTPRRNGTTRLMMSPLELMLRLAAVPDDSFEALSFRPWKSTTGRLETVAVANWVPVS